MKEIERPKVALGIILMDFEKEKILLGQRKGKLGAGNWGLVGGHLEMFEELVDCGAREIKEEIGLEKNINFRPLDYYPIAATNDIFTFENKHYTTLFLRFIYLQGEIKNLEPAKCYGWDWFSWNKLPNPLSPPIHNLVKQGYDPFR